MPNEALDVTTPVLLMGGMQNTLSIVRSLGRERVSVSVSSATDCLALHSRYCADTYPYPVGIAPGAFWNELLLSEPKPLRGAMLLTCSDDAIEFVADNKEALRKHYVVDESIPELQHAMLDKQRTLELAQEAGCPVPLFWNITLLEDVNGIKDSVTFPVMIKPIHSHIFMRYYGGKKHLLANDFEELLAMVSGALGKGVEVMVCEIIPGPDTLLSSYYTYLDDSGNALFHFTKKVIRRFPVNSGGATYHITEWDQETAELGERFFRGIKFRGLGNIEFKRDLRDGNLKVIECNPRFTAAQELLVQSGMDIALVIYRRLSGQPAREIAGYRDHVRLLEPWRDYKAYKQLREMGEITFREWVKSIMHKQISSVYRSDDLRPFFVKISFMLSRLVSRMRAGKGFLDSSLNGRSI